MSIETTGNCWAAQKFHDAKHFGVKYLRSGTKDPEVIGVTFTEVGAPTLASARVCATSRGRFERV